MGNRERILVETRVSIDERLGYPEDEQGCEKDSSNDKTKHIWVILTLVSVIALVSLANVIHSQKSVDLFEEYSEFYAYLFLCISFIPYLSFPVTFINCIGIVLLNPFSKVKSKYPLLMKAPFICFRVVTRGDLPEFVKQNALKNFQTCHRYGLERFVIEIVTDNPLNCSNIDENIREIVVPKDYVTKNGTRFKARALNYCLESHVNTLAGNDWIVHLDEETLLTTECLSGILQFVTECNSDIGQGPISYANGKVIKNWVTTLADSMRLGLDYSLFRFQFTYLHRPLFGLKGSYIVIRNRVEMDVGFDFGPEGSIAEDCYFALKAWDKGYTFDFITGEMREQSPFTLLDYIRQRRRWFIGQLYTVLSREIPLKNKLCLLLSLSCCILMPLSLSNIVIDRLFPFHKPVPLCVLDGFVGGTFIFLYAFGAYLSTCRRRWSYVRRAFICVMCSLFILPLVAILESAAVYWGICTLSSKDFFIIQKQADDKQCSTERQMKIHVL